MKQTVVEWEKVKEKDFSKVLSKDIFGQTSKDLEISQRANMSSTEITVFIHTSIFCISVCFMFNIYKCVFKMYITNVVDISRVNSDEI